MILAYLIASGFMAVYHMGVDTIFICACKQNISNSFIHPLVINLHNGPYLIEGLRASVV